MDANRICVLPKAKDYYNYCMYLATMYVNILNNSQQ